MLEDNTILNIVENELSQSVGSAESGFLYSNRQAALATYLGQPDGKEVEGRSSVVSTDVADAIEWIMPEIVKAFTQNNEVVTFDPCYDGDEDQAELESQYVYDILMKDNNGFLVIHQFIKDALMQKNGFLKVHYDKDEKESVETYTGLTEVELQMVLADPENELQEMTEIEGQIPTFDISVLKTVVNSKICVVSVPPEEFRINRLHNSVDVSGARFTAHVLLKYAGDLVEEGHDKELIDSIPTSEVFENDREYRFYVQGEEVGLDDNLSGDASLRPLEISECYMKMDVNEDGIAELVKVTVAGGNNPTHILSIEPIDGNPFISSTAILMSHKLFGLSIYDRLKQIQDQKTSLWRNILDNMYLQNNQRTVVVENQVNLDDLMVSRPGGIIRAKTLGAVAPYVTPPLGADAYKMMDYLDQVRAGRSGVSPEGPVTDSMVGDRVGSEGIASMMSQKEELVGLMIRVIAETGIKPLCYKIRDEAIKHQDVMKDYMFRGQWKQVNPSKWRNRSHTTIRVGTGTGNKQAQMGALSQLMMSQEKILMNPSQSLITEEQVFNAINDFAKHAGMPSARRYVLDPKSPEGQKNKQAVTKAGQEAKQAEMMEKKVMAESTAKIAQAEVSKAETAGQNVQLKSQIDFQKNQIAMQKQSADNQIAFLKQQLEKANIVVDDEAKGRELQFKYYQVDEQIRVQEKQIQATAKAASDNNKEKPSE